MPKHDKPEDPKAKAEAEAKRPKRYVCVVPCWHNGHLFRRGQTAKFTEDQLPRHNNGKVAHFELIGPDTVVPPPADGVNVTVNKEDRAVR